MELEPFMAKLAGHLPDIISMVSVDHCEMQHAHSPQNYRGFLYVRSLVKPPPMSALLPYLNPTFSGPMQKLRFSLGAFAMLSYH